MYWFSIEWWGYLLEKPAPETSGIKAFWCRMRGHPNGVWYYNPNGSEPDMTCKDCGDDLG